MAKKRRKSHKIIKRIKKHATSVAIESSKSAATNLLTVGMVAGAMWLLGKKA